MGAARPLLYSSGSSVNVAPGPASAAIDVREFVDRAPFSLYQRLLLAVCFVTTFFDGFDTQAVAVAAPSIRLEMALQPAQLGTVFAAGSLGGIFAAFAMAPFADRFGRRPLIVTSVLVSAALSLCYPLADNFLHLLALRFTAGVFLAVAVTVTYSYAAELAPKRAAATAIMVTSAGFGLGVAATGFLSGWLIPAFGWRSIFYVGGAATLLLGIILLAFLPESVRVMATRERDSAKVRRFLRRIDPKAAMPDGASFCLNEERKPGVHFRHVLGEGRALTSVALWTSFFFINYVIYVLMQWLPSFVASGGGDAAAAGAAVGWFKLGGIAGSFICAAYIDRRGNPYPILVGFLLFGCAAFLGLAKLPPEAGLFALVVGVTGILLSGPMYATNGLMGRLFPTYVRAGGMALTAGVGRLGAMTGPFTVGLLLQAGWSGEDVFQAAVIPTLTSTIIIAALGLRERGLLRKKAS